MHTITIFVSMSCAALVLSIHSWKPHPAQKILNVSSSTNAPEILKQFKMEQFAQIKSQLDVIFGNINL